jgi:hypothetical protein
MQSHAFTLQGLGELGRHVLKVMFSTETPFLIFILLRLAEAVAARRA